MGDNKREKDIGEEETLERKIARGREGEKSMGNSRGSKREVSRENMLVSCTRKLTHSLSDLGGRKKTERNLIMITRTHTLFLAYTP